MKRDHTKSMNLAVKEARSGRNCHNLTVNSIIGFIKTSGALRHEGEKNCNEIGEGLTLWKTFELSVDLKLEGNQKFYDTEVLRFQARVSLVSSAKLQF